MAEDWRVLIEAGLLAAVLVPVACSGSVRRSLAALGRTRQGVLGAMLLLALGAQFALATRAFPFVDWKMYASLPAGDPVVFEYNVELRSGRRAALVPGRYMGRESADRFVESLRRRVQAGEAAPALRVLARLFERHEGARVGAVVVSERRVSISSGRRGPARERMRVAMAP